MPTLHRITNSPPPTYHYPGSVLGGTPLRNQRTSPAKPRTLDESTINDTSEEPTLPWGADNLEPQRLLQLSQASPTSSNCVDQKAKFIAGQGVALMPNSNNQAVAELDALYPHRGLHALLQATARSMALFDAFAWQVRYTPSGAIADLHPIPMEQVRRTAVPGVYRVSPSWGANGGLRGLGSLGSTFNHAAFHDLPAFAPHRAKAQMAAARAASRPYNGQLLVYPEPQHWPTYHTPAWSSAQRYAELEATLSNFFANQVANSFSADLLLEVYGDFNHPAGGQTAAERQAAFKARLEGYRGAQGAGEIMVLFGEQASDLLKLHRLEPTGNDALYQSLCREAELKLARAHQVPPVLAGILVAGRLGASSEIQEAAHFFQNACIDDAQDAIAAQLARILPHHRTLRSISASQTPFLLRKKATLHIPEALYGDMTLAERRVHLLGLDALPSA